MKRITYFVLILVILIIVNQSNCVLSGKVDTTMITSTTIEVSTTKTTTSTSITGTTICTGCTTTTIYSIPAPSWQKAMIQISAVDSYTMGDGNYGPNVNMNITHDFKISKYEVTNSWFNEAVVDGLYSNSIYWTINGWNYKQDCHLNQPIHKINENNTDQPISMVSWYECTAFCNWLSIKEGYSAVYSNSGYITSLTKHGYRLPTEVEWEYCAAKGGNDQAERIYTFGDVWDCTKTKCEVSPCSSMSESLNVGSKISGNTPQGLSDMDSNLLEWCSDNYISDGSILGGINRYYFMNDSYYMTFVLRGGSSILPYEYRFRCSYRCLSQNNPYFPSVSVGFRVLLP